MGINKFSDKHIFEFGICGFSILLPSFPFTSSIGLALFLSCSMFTLLKKKNFLFDKKIMLAGTFFFICLYSTFYSYNFEEAVASLIKILPIIVIPFILSSVVVDQIVFVRVKIFFLFSVFFVSVFSVLVRLYGVAFLGSQISSLKYISLAEVFHLHPTYFSMYILLAVWFALGNLKKSLIKIVVILFLCATLLLLESRMGVIILLLIMIYFFFRGRKLKLGYIICFLLLTLSIFYIQKERFSDFNVQMDSLIGYDLANGISQRLWLWKESLLMISERPFFGYGYKSLDPYFSWFVENQIMETNIFKGFEDSARVFSTYNFHNQYLQIIFDSGIIGLFMFLSSKLFMILNTYTFSRNNDFLFYLLLVMSFLFSENILDRQMGLYFYALFTSLLFKEALIKDRIDEKT